MVGQNPERVIDRQPAHQFSFTGRGVHPPKLMMHIAYSPPFPQKIINSPPYIRKIYKFPLFSFNLHFWLKLLFFTSFPILTMIHLRIMPYTYWTPLFTDLC